LHCAIFWHFVKRKVKIIVAGQLKMVDVVDKKIRSRMMSGIQGKNTKPEMLIRSMLHKNGFRYRIHANTLPGKPDIVLKRYQAVIFVHGCFWHGHKCHLFKWPKTRPEFWQNKIQGNIENDKKVMKKIEALGWRVCIVWECSVKGASKDIIKVSEQITKWLTSKILFMEIEG